MLKPQRVLCDLQVTEQAAAAESVQSARDEAAAEANRRMAALKREAVARLQVLRPNLCFNFSKAYQLNLMRLLILCAGG